MTMLMILKILNSSACALATEFWCEGSLKFTLHPPPARLVGLLGGLHKMLKASIGSESPYL
jgi:hypothetical protein